jgi:DNA (cytosine-5)-methyltransferase 1
VKPIAKGGCLKLIRHCCKLSQKRESTNDKKRPPNLMPKNRIKTFSDFCAGIGGFRIALESAGLACTYTAESDGDALRTYNHNFKEVNTLTDITKVDAKRLPNFDVMCAGFPCQPFSIAGKRLGLSDERSGVLPKLIEIIKRKKPKIIILENVKNFGSFGGGSLLEATKSSISKHGYNVFHAVLDASRFGVPQIRKRLFIVAIQKKFGIEYFSFPKGSDRTIPFRQVIVKGDDSIPVTKKWDEYIDYYTGEKKLGDLSFTPPKTRTSLERKDKNIKLTDCIFQMRSSGIRALSIDKPLPTLAVSISGGGAMIPVYSKERRHLSLLEMKRLMGFNDNFEFPVSRTSAIKQLANAVCPPVVAALIFELLAALKNQAPLKDRN